MGGGCTAKETFVVCNGRLDITPGPGKTTLDSAYVEVCWAAGEGPETINFDCCGSFFLLGNCDCSCVTTLVYDGAGCTSSALLQMRGDAVIDSSGSGPLVLTSVIGSAQPEPSATNCHRTLTLTGTNDDHNEIRGIFQPPSNKVCNVIKDGVGTWRFNGAGGGPPFSRISGTLHIQNGTIREATGKVVPSQFDIGDDATDATGQAVFFLEAGVGSGSLFVAEIVVLAAENTQVVLVGGGAGSRFSEAGMWLGRDVTLFAETGGTVDFQTFWFGGTYPTQDTAASNVTIGTADYQGKVLLNANGPLFTSGEVIVAYGEAAIGMNATLETGGGVTINAGATLSVVALISNPGDLATSATFADDTLTVAFSGDPTTGDEYILLLGPTNNTIATVTLTGTTQTGTYDSATSTLTID
jgi:hypothetical protein